MFGTLGLKRFSHDFEEVIKNGVRSVIYVLNSDVYFIGIEESFKGIVHETHNRRYQVILA